MDKERGNPRRIKDIKLVLAKDLTTVGIGTGGSMAILNSFEGRPLMTIIGAGILLGSGGIRLLLERRRK